MVDSEKVVESRRACGWSRHRCFVFILLVAAFYFLCSSKIMEMAADWNHTWGRQHNTTKELIPLSSQRLNVDSPNMTESSGNTGPSSELTAAAGVTSETGWSVFPDSENNTLTNVSVVTQQRPESTTPVSYVSPGPYLVEYPYEYHFIINEPKKCEQQNPFVVLMVPVAPNNKAHRDIIRNTWGGENLVLDKVVQLFFLLGLYTGEGAEQLQEQLLQESKEHQDLIQSNFRDCYKNLTIKTMVMLEWLDSYCSNTSYAMKIDSDMFLNVPNLINMLSEAPKTNYMTGLVSTGAAVLRDPSSKWYVPVEIYPNSQYPRYALGLGYVLSLDLPKKLVEASRHVKAIYIEDVFLGFCMQHLGISPTDPPDWGYFNVFPVSYSRCAYSKLIATTTHENTDRVAIWKDFITPGSYC